MKPRYVEAAVAVAAATLTLAAIFAGASIVTRWWR
jgi:hypothetical protein